MDRILHKTGMDSETFVRQLDAWLFVRKFCMMNIHGWTKYQWYYQPAYRKGMN